MKTHHSLSHELAAQRHSSLSRCHFLRGLGACLALPALDSLRPFGALAAEAGTAAPLAKTATGAPLRMVFVYFPNGAIQPTWWPMGLLVPSVQYEWRISERDEQ